MNIIHHVQNQKNKLPNSAGRRRLLWRPHKTLYLQFDFNNFGDIQKNSIEIDIK